jgi:hypothetical protein
MVWHPSRVRVCLLFCHPFDLFAQPTGKSFFEFHLRAGLVKVIYPFPGFSQGNEPARRTLPLKLGRHKLHQWTLGARVRAGGIIEIEAGRGILEYIRSPPRRARRTPVPAILQKSELELKHLENLSVVSPHKLPHPS